MKKLAYIFITFLIVSFSSRAQEKEVPPKGSEPKGFTLPEKEVVTLDNGLNLVMVPYGAIPKATITIMVKAGNIHEKEDETWLPDLLADLMKEGSTSMDAEEIANRMAGMGGDLNVSVGPHNTNLNSSVLYEFAPDAIGIMADVLMNPSFPESELERLKNDMKRNINLQLSRPQSQARKDFFAKIYPDHPYGNLFSTEEIVDGFTVDAIKKFYDENYGAKRTTVYVAGKFDRKSVEKAVRDAFAAWREGPEDNYPTAKAVASGDLAIIDRAGAPQSTIMYGLPVVDPSDKDYIPLMVTNSILGGSFGSRITSNIREDKGYTYSPRSRVETNYKSGVWYEFADVTTAYTGASLEEIKKEIVRLQNEPPSKEELEGIQNYEAGVFVLRNSTPGGIIGQLSFLEIHDLPESDLQNRVQRIYEVTPEMVQEMTQKYITPDHMTLVVVGDKKVIEKQIEDFQKQVKSPNVE
ncbi:M16 family metallopeptidase [Sungkyunkwania multivorans]|uniref:M16 family metallopeptidase n=1 Tax=Sungkyunkwania multivorans TaxID=1173618 RepID=A0ABW3CYA6_9FLAO